MFHAFASRPYAPLHTLRSALSLAAGIGFALPAAAQIPDYTLGSKVIVQSVQTGTTALVGGKSTFVRAPLSATGHVPPTALLDGLMRVFVNGIEAPYSPVYSDNGPIVAQAYDPENESSSLNFIFLPPISNNVELRFELNPAGPNQVAESNYANNNSVVSGLVFVCHRVPELVYVPVDYRPNGETTPNLPPLDMIAPGSGDNFVQGIYPVGDWNYHRSVAPSKLWTSSLAGSGSSILSALITDQNLMVPKPDLIYGWIPGGLGYNGQAAGIPATAAMGNTEQIRFQRTLAHELGHCHGMQHNSTTNNTVGVDVENHLNEPLVLPTLKTASLKDIMYAGLFTPEAWIAPSSYDFCFNNAWYTCPTADSEPTPGASLLVAGLWDRAADSIGLSDVLVTPDGVPTASVPFAAADLVLRAWSGGVLVSEVGFAALNTHDSCAECAGDSAEALDPVHGFSVVVKTSVDPDAIEKLALSDARTGKLLAEVLRSAHAPQLALVAPLAGAAVGGKLNLEWRADDADGDALHYYVRYSPGGGRVVPLATQLTATSYEVDFDQLPALGEGAWLEVIATDGLSTTRVRTQGLYAGSADGSGNAPFTYIATPDAGMSYPRKATVILHGNAWDLENQMLSGPSLTWTSSLDGPIGTGRLARTSALSVGTHVITLRAQDASGQFTTDTTTITITDRPLPGAAIVCQTSLGFGGPGAATLSFCGGNLSTGTTATLELAGAKANAAAWIAIGPTNTPTPFLGGTAVPLPFTTILAGATNASGKWTMPNVPGGGGPLTLYCQAAYLDAALPFGVGLSNALKVDFLP
jgi:hypothetical protein